MPAAERDPPPDTAACIEHRLQPFLDIDARLPGIERPGPAEISTLAEIAERCRGPARDAVVACVARDVADRFLDRSGESTDVTGVAVALRDGSTRCTPLSLLALATAECADIEIEAVIYREHVAVLDPASPETVFDLLDRGRPASADTMRTMHPIEPTGERRRQLSGMVAIYLDSLATDPANADDDETVRALLDAARDSDPDDPRLRFNRGVFLLRDEQFSDALDTLLAAERAGWIESDLHAYIGLAHEHTGNREGAIARFRQALDLDPRNRVARDGLTRNADEAGRP